jgi:hypothetical protein
VRPTAAESRCDLRNLAISEIELRERLNPLESEWVIGKLTAKRGVRRANYGRDGTVVVEYDADVIDSADIVSFLYVCGLTATGKSSARGRRGSYHSAIRR